MLMPHSGHALDGEIIDRCNGTRYATTLKKDPTIEPKVPTRITTLIRQIADGSAVAESARPRRREELPGAEIDGGEPNREEVQRESSARINRGGVHLTLPDIATITDRTR